MTLESARKELNRLAMDKSRTGAEYNAILTAMVSLSAWDKLKKSVKSMEHLEAIPVDGVMTLIDACIDGIEK